jgi:hypothetical protein
VKIRLVAAALAIFSLTACGTTSASPTDSSTPSNSQSPSATPTPSETYSPPPIEKKSWLNIIDRVVTKTKYWEEFSYPEFSTVKSGNASLEKIVNDLNTEVMTLVNDFKKRMKSDYAKTARADWYPGITTLSGVQEIGSTNLVFIHIEHFEQSYPQAHSDGSIWSEVYDLRTGAKLDIESQLLHERKDYFLDLVVNTLIEQVGEEALDDRQTMWDQLSSWADFICWSVADEGISIVFNPYVVGPYASGTPAVSIPWQQLTKDIDPKSVIGKEFAAQLNFK